MKRIYLLFVICMSMLLLGFGLKKARNDDSGTSTKEFYQLSDAKANVINLKGFLQAKDGDKPKVAIISDITIIIDGNGEGRTFDGVGAISAGASSRLLYD